MHKQISRERLFASFPTGRVSLKFALMEAKLINISQYHSLKRAATASTLSLNYIYSVNVSKPNTAKKREKKKQNREISVQ